VKSGWKTEQLGELCEFKRGLTYAKGDEVDVSDNIVLRATNIDLTTNLLDFTELKYINDNVVVPDSKKVKKGSLMICTASGSKSHLGKVAYIDDDYDYSFGGFMGMITPKNNLVPRYLFHLMTSAAYKDFIGALSDGVNINNLKFDDLKTFRVPHPACHEQQRIVGILDEAFDGIATAKANAEKNLQNTRALFENHLQSVFTRRGEGWVEKKLGDVCEVKDGTHESPKYVATGIPFVTQKNIRDDGLSFAKTKFISQEDHIDFYRRSNVYHGDILISMIGANRGMACIVDDERVFSIKNVGLVKQNGAINQQFLLYFLKSSQAANYVRSESKGGAQEFIGLTELRKFPVPLPELSHQNTLVAKFDALSAETQRLASIYQQKLTALEALKKSLLNQAFTGEL
jgi:type I restriction enzyme S subunit